MGKEIDNKVIITGLVVFGIVVIFLGVMNFLEHSTGYNTISATGEGTVSVMPDFIVVYFNIQTRGVTAKDANAENSLISGEVLASLELLGISEEEIKTEGFSVYPDYDWGANTQKTKGYVVTNSISVKLDVANKEKVGSILDSGIGAGAGVDYVGYELSEENRDIYEAEAIMLAARDAKVKAEALVGGIDKKLGNIVSLSTNEGFYRGPWIAYSSENGDSVSTARGAEIATAINPSEQEVSARVNVVYDIR